jgi:hypothetical protein
VSQLPPPDETFPEGSFHLVADGVRLYIVGLINQEPAVEVLAGDGSYFYRFVLPKHSRNIRKFWKSIGVVDTSRLQEGAYDSKEGYGPFHLEGLAIGKDTPSDIDAKGAIVLENVELSGGV